MQFTKQENMNNPSVELCPSLRIGFDAKRLFFNHSGLGNYGRNLLSAFFYYHPEHAYFLFTPNTDAALFPQGKSNIVLPQGIYASFPLWWRYNRIGHDAQPYNLDIYHGLSNELPNDIGKSHAKQIVSIHDTIFMRYPQWYKWHDRMLYKQKTAFACKTADAIIAVSKQTKEDLMYFFHVKEDKIHVIYQPCNPIFTENPTAEQQSELKNKLNLPDKFVLMVGNIEQRKNIATVIKAIQQQAEHIPLLLVGKDNSYASQLKQQLRRSNIKNVYFCHHVSLSDLVVLYKMASVLVYASFFEGFGIPVLEALHCGTPVIASNSSSLKETGGDAVLYVRPEREDEIAQALYTILHDSELRENNIQKGKEHIKRFSPNVIVEEMINLYKQI
jgi:glycosyltransferase involved in cell wall biosynthesis